VTASSLLGHVAGVAGGAVTVRQSPSVASGIAIVGGKAYRIGQVGSFVRIPQGYHDLYGIVVQVGVSATDGSEAGIDPGERLITLQLVGELVGGEFERGISQYPSIHDEVHIVTEDNLARIYQIEGPGQVIIGRLANAEAVEVKVDLNKLVTRHSAVLGSTGSGKSTTVASLLRAVTATNYHTSGVDFPSSRVLLIDIHGEYSSALGDEAKVFRIGASGSEAELKIPFWALEARDLMELLLGRLDDRVWSQVADKILSYKSARSQIEPALAGLNLNSLTADSPVPFSLKRLWFELLDPEVKTWANAARTEPALIDPGNADTLAPPRYHPHTNTNTPPFQNMTGVLGIRRPLDQMRSRLLDRQFAFLFEPGDWTPNQEGVTEKDLEALLEAWLGHDRSITILDLSSVPSAVLERLIGTILRIVYEALYWGREIQEGGRKRPLLVVMEEAHRYLGKSSGGLAHEMAQRIVKEGRKFGIGAMVVSQRPSEVDETVLSQCGTFVALRLSNAADRNRVQSTLPDSLTGIAESLPVLRTGEAIITGEAAKLPIRCRVTLPPEGKRPRGEDPKVAESWSKPNQKGDYGRLAGVWRAQDPKWKPE
jgi:DNA helicase HerA-like ATPase